MGDGGGSERVRGGRLEEVSTGEDQDASCCCPHTTSEECHDVLFPSRKCCGGVVFDWGWDRRAISFGCPFGMIYASGGSGNHGFAQEAQMSRTAKSVRWACCDVPIHPGFWLNAWLVC